MKLKKQNEGLIFIRNIKNTNIEFNTNINTEERFKAFHDHGFNDLFICDCEKCKQLTKAKNILNIAKNEAKKYINKDGTKTN